MLQPLVADVAAQTSVAHALLPPPLPQLIRKHGCTGGPRRCCGTCACPAAWPATATCRPAGRMSRRPWSCWQLACSFPQVCHAASSKISSRGSDFAACGMQHHHFTSRPSAGLQTAKCPAQSGLLMTQNRATGPLLDVHPGSPCTFRSSPTDLGPSWQPTFGWAGQHVPSLLQGRPMSEMGP